MTPFATARAPTIRESAGVRIVQNPSRLQAALVFKLGQHRLKVGGLEDDPSVEFNHNPAICAQCNCPRAEWQ